MIGLDLMGAGTFGSGKLIPLTAAEIRFPWFANHNFWPGEKVYFPSGPPTTDSKVWAATEQTMGKAPGAGAPWRIDDAATSEARSLEATDPIYRLAVSAVAPSSPAATLRSESSAAATGAPWLAPSIAVLLLLGLLAALRRRRA